MENRRERRYDWTTVMKEKQTKGNRVDANRREANEDRFQTMKMEMLEFQMQNNGKEMPENEGLKTICFQISNNGQSETQHFKKIASIAKSTGDRLLVDRLVWFICDRPTFATWSIGFPVRPLCRLQRDRLQSLNGTLETECPSFVLRRKFRNFFTPQKEIAVELRDMYNAVLGWNEGLKKDKWGFDLACQDIR
uniref:Uncharacterized protein n=1 Tax=Cucumis melo TaxID=3656 RepID=A0A9I9EKI1_CUCME